MTINKTRTPVFFELIDQEDNRFRKVKIKIAHTGENLNNTYFSKETLEEMTSSLSNIPIVGFLEKNSDGDNDFSDHRQTIVVKKGDIDLEYAGHAYGFIPEENNAQIEVLGGKEWLTCEGYLWTKFKSVMEIFDEANGYKSQSMEIQDVIGEADDIGRMVITGGRFSALCILGEDHNPAMTGSTVQLYSDNQAYSNEINEMMMEFSSSKKKKKKGESDLPETKNEQEIKDQATEPEVEPVVEDTTVEPEVEPTVDPAVEPETTMEPEPEVEPEVNEEPEVDEDGDEASFSVVETEKGITVNYSLSHDNIRHGLVSAMYAKLGDECYVYPVDIYDDHAIFNVYEYQSGTEKFIDATYTKSDSDVQLGESTEVVAMFVTPGEASKIESDREEYAALQAQLKELQAYKAEKENGAKEAVLKEFAEVIGTEKQEEIKANFSKMSIKDVEKEVAFEVLQVSKGNIKEELAESRATNFSATKSDGRYGTLDKYFNK